jgi:hypothetical protein
MTVYNLTKLSDGGILDLYTESEDVVSQVLEGYCCKQCIEEAKQAENYLGGLLFSSCGAEFMLTEMMEEQYNKLEYDLN